MIHVVSLDGVIVGTKSWTTTARGSEMRGCVGKDVGDFTGWGDEGEHGSERGGVYLGSYRTISLDKDY